MEQQKCLIVLYSYDLIVNISSKLIVVSCTPGFHSALWRASGKQSNTWAVLEDERHSSLQGTAGVVPELCADLY